MATETGFGTGARQRSKRTPKSVTYGDLSSIVGFAVTQGNCRVSLTNLPSGEQSGDTTIIYTLTNPRATTASITPQYSTDGGSTWSTATSAGGDDGTSPLTTSAAGISHTFIWDTVTDLTTSFLGDIFFRILAYDLASQGGDFEQSGQYKISVDNAPLAPSVVSPTEGYFDKNETPSFVATIPSPVEGNSDMHAKLEIDPQSTFDSETDAQGNKIPFKTFESRLDQVGWEYDSTGSGDWVNIPFAGIPVVSDPNLIGKQCRYTVPTEERLTPGDYKQRWSFGEVK